MVDIFGANRRKGKKGDRGPSGPAGEGLSSFFFGKQLSRWFYENLSFSCFFKNKTSGLIIEKDKVVAIKNQVGNNHAVAINEFEHLTEIPDYGYGVNMSKSLYQVDNLQWAPANNSKAILFFAFKITTKPGKDLQYIFHNGNDRAIYIKGPNLVIQACAEAHHRYLIPYEEHAWNVCFVEFNTSTSLRSRYKINDVEGYFESEPSQMMSKVLYIGGKDKQFFKGVLARFDFYSNFKEEGEIMDNLPDSVKTSVIKELYLLPLPDTDNVKRRKMDETE